MSHALLEWAPSLFFGLCWLLLSLANWWTMLRNLMRKGERPRSLLPIIGALFAAGAVVKSPLEGTTAWIAFVALVVLDPGSLVLPVIFHVWKERR